MNWKTNAFPENFNLKKNGYLKRYRNSRLSVFSDKRTTLVAAVWIGIFWIGKKGKSSKIKGNFENPEKEIKLLKI